MTRPRPPFSPALAGAVDLSALKQRSQHNAGPGGAGPDGASPWQNATEITEANFEAEVLIGSNRVPVVVLLWSPRSDVCLQLAETLSGLAAADAGKWSLATVNVDTVPRVAQMFGVEAVPTVVALGGGQPLSSFQGRLPADELRRWLDSVLEATAGKLSGTADPETLEEVDPALAQARQQFESGELTAAVSSYQVVLDADPHHHEAKGAIRQITFLVRATAQRADAVEAADAAPGDIEAAFAAADVQILNQKVKAAFDRLIALLRRTSDDERTAVRTRLVELFELFEPTDPEVVAGRRNLANALY